MIPDNGSTAPPTIEQTDPPKRRRLYPVNEVAVLIGVTPRKTWSLIRAKRIKAVRIDGRRLVPAEALEEFLGGLTDEDVPGA